MSEHCDCYNNGSTEECGGPMFSDPQPELDLKVCAPVDMVVAS